MLGYYDYTVVLTYISLICGVIGIACAKLKHPLTAIILLLICGFCDAFDGKVARSKKNRTQEEQSFGIQIDSLCDLVSFGVLPATICMEIWGENLSHSRYSWVLVTAVCAFYVLAGVIRLGFFNVTEQTRQAQTPKPRTLYQGLPITSACLIFPTAYILRFFLSESLFPILFTALMFLTGICFIAPFHMKKPTGKVIFGMVLVGLLVAAILVAVFLVHAEAHIQAQAS